MKEGIELENQPENAPHFVQFCVASCEHFSVEAHPNFCKILVATGRSFDTLRARF
jgi:hypothetical protein